MKPLAASAREPACAFSSSTKPAKTISVSCGRDFAFASSHKRGEHRGHGTFGVARAASVQPAVFPARNELRIVGIDGVEVRREQDGLADFVSRQQARDEIGASQIGFFCLVGRAYSRAGVATCNDRLAGSLAPLFEINFLEFNIESGMGGDGGEEICHILFTIMRLTKAGLSRRSSIGWSEGGIHAGQRDEFGQQFFRARHAPTV